MCVCNVTSVMEHSKQLTETEDNAMRQVDPILIAFN